MPGAILVDRFRYGAVALWAVRGDLHGRSARQMGERVDLFFRGGERSLLLDLRGACAVDSAGAATLRRCVARPGCRIVGRPAAWDDLPLPVRCTLDDLGAAPDLLTALAEALPAGVPQAGAEHRAHRRIPVQIPVEILSGGAAVLVSLRDISRAGVGLDLVPPAWIPDLRCAPADLGVRGLAGDPLCRELAGGLMEAPVPLAVARCGDDGRVGARFLEGHPPG